MFDLKFVRNIYIYAQGLLKVKKKLYIKMYNDVGAK
jgi:hypothetical protein